MSEPWPTLHHPGLYARGTPSAVWARLRRECPVAWRESTDHDPYWAVTAYAPGLQVLTDWRNFSSANGTVLRADLSTPFPGAGTMLALSDPPRHTALRKAISHLFTPRAVARLEPGIRTVARRLVEQAVAAGDCDFARDVAAPYPLAVTAELLGIAAEDLTRVSALANAVSRTAHDLGATAARTAHLEVLYYYAGIVASRRARPGADFVSALIAARPGGAPITDEEIILACDNVVVAASETTRYVISAGLLTLLEDPAQLAGLLRGQVPLDALVEEMLRWAMPVNHIMRTAVHRTRVLGQEILPGQAVGVWIPALNRDESVFRCQDTFDAGRHPNRHLSFGGGIHFCLGAALARRSIRVLFEELARALGPDGEVVLAGEPERVASYAVNEIASLPVRLDRGPGPGGEAHRAAAARR